MFADSSSSSSKFFGNPNDPKAKQQSTLAFKTSNESTNPKEEVDDEDLQPRKKRTIRGTVKDENTKGDVKMEDDPEATITTNEKSPVDGHGSKVGAKGMTRIPVTIMHLPLVLYAS